MLESSARARVCVGRPLKVVCSSSSSNVDAHRSSPIEASRDATSDILPTASRCFRNYTQYSYVSVIMFPSP